MTEEKRQPAGLKERLDYNEDFKLDWHDKDEAHDGYQLKWVGKNYARLEAGTAADTMIYPDEKHNVQKNNADSGNLFFTGDNLQALKHLQNCYKGAVKMIYIDPPYNTGSDGFVYPDKFEFSDEKLQSLLGLSPDEMKRLKILNGRSSHSAWLTFMYPRLKIAKSLLREDGVIFISIDDNEQANLKLLCDEIFGEGNFLGNIAWESKTKSQNTKSSYNKIQPKIEYILCYTKSDGRRFNLIEKGQKEYPLSDEQGPYREYPLEVMNATGIRGRESMVYEIEGIAPPLGKQWQLGQDQVAAYRNSGNLFVREGIAPPLGKQWKLGQDKVSEYRDSGNLFIRDRKVIIKMRPEFEKNELTEPFWAFIPKETGTAESAKKELNILLDGDNIFDTVKPVELVKRLVFHASAANAILATANAGGGAG